MASDRFITFFYAHLDGASRTLQYVNAGHNPPIVLHQDGSHHRLTEGGGGFGVFPTQTFALGATQLRVGDRLVLYTDGVTEAADIHDEEFGDERLVRLLQANSSSSANEIQARILQNVGEFCGGRWHDDATLLVLAVS
jgi:phosphoserine phosphatase RsbU/P